jgi:hypothetical protein
MKKKYRYWTAAVTSVLLAVYALGGWMSQKIDQSVPVTKVERLNGENKAVSEKMDVATITKYLPRSLNEKNTASAIFKPKAALSNPAQVVAEAKVPAKNGSASAMYWLSSALRYCSRADMGTNEEIETKVAKRSIGLDAMAKDGGGAVDPEQQARNAANMARELEILRDECKQLPADDIKSWRDWLEKSAAAGDGEARADFAHTVMNEFNDPAYKEEHYAEFSRENTLARSYLDDSVANGDCGNDILNGFRWIQMDATSKYIYQGLLLKHAFDDISTNPKFSAEYVDRETSSVSAFLKNLAYDVPIDARAEAENSSDYILRNICQRF